MIDLKPFQSVTVYSVIIHSAIWLVLIHLQFDLFGLAESFYIGFIEKEPFIDDAFLIMPTQIGLFYLNSHVLVPLYLKRKSWWKYLLLIAFSFFIAVFIGAFLFNFLASTNSISDIHEVEEFLDYSFVFHLIVIGISTSLGISKIALKNEEQTREAQQLQKKAELQYLKAQVTPHFLFNSLNTVYSFANEEGAENTSDAILKLSEMMRYITNEASQPKVDLQKEIDFIQNYIDLQQLRLTGNVSVKFNIKGHVPNRKIAPLLFISIVENAFKHGISYKEPSPIYIELNIQKAFINLCSKNAKYKNIVVQSSEIGLSNVRSRLIQLYPNAHQFRITENKDFFEVNLTIEF